MSLDVGTFVLKSGTITLLAPVNRFITGAIFVGAGHFTLKPAGGVETSEMTRRTGNPIAEEDFTEVVFRFTPGEYAEFAGTLGTKTDTPPEAAAVFKHWRDKLRRRHEIPEGFTQGILEARNDRQRGRRRARGHLQSPNILRFSTPTCTALGTRTCVFSCARVWAQFPNWILPEEVALINCNGGEMDDGIWYSQHLGSELKAHTANSREDRRLFATHRYNIETVDREEQPPLQPCHPDV